VLLVEKHALTRDVVTGHYIHPPGVAYLARWGLLDETVAGWAHISLVTAALGSGRFTLVDGKARFTSTTGQARRCRSEPRP
jgi:hypothetical protein